jgi:hypothetical protein
MGRAADPWRAAETWIPCLASHRVPLHATAALSAHPDLAHLPAEPGICNRHDRSWRSRSAIGRASCSRSRIDRASCLVRYYGAGWHWMAPLPGLPSHHRPYSCYRHVAHPILLIGATLHGGCMPVPPPATTLGSGDHWTITCRRLLRYRSRASPRRKLPAFKNFARPTAAARTRQTSHNSYRAIVLRVRHERPVQKHIDRQCPSPTDCPSTSRLLRTRL